MSQTRDRLSREGVVPIREFGEVIIPRAVRGDHSTYERSGDNDLGRPLSRIGRIIGSITVAIEASFHCDRFRASGFSVIAKVPVRLFGYGTTES